MSAPTSHSHGQRRVSLGEESLLSDEYPLLFTEKRYAYRRFVCLSSFGCAAASRLTPRQVQLELRTGAGGERPRCSRIHPGRPRRRVYPHSAIHKDPEGKGVSPAVAVEAGRDAVSSRAARCLPPVCFVFCVGRVCGRLVCLRLFLRVHTCVWREPACGIRRMGKGLSCWATLVVLLGDP